MNSQRSSPNVHPTTIMEISIIIGNKGHEDLQAYLGDGSDFGVKFTYID